VIIFNLRCSNGHSFEGWFASGEAFDEQIGRRLVCCPVCDDHGVVRLPSAPWLKRPPAESAPATDVAAGAPRMRALLDAVAGALAESEDVGERFPDEARRIHYDEAPSRSIRGQASVREALELIDEGIVVLPVPGPGKKTSH
jgi:hypothetical protein